MNIWPQLIIDMLFHVLSSVFTCFHVLSHAPICIFTYFHLFSLIFTCFLVFSCAFTCFDMCHVEKSLCDVWGSPLVTFFSSRFREVPIEHSFIFGGSHYRTFLVLG